jgi:hypothetical protein
MSPRRDRLPPDPRHAAVKALLQLYWQKENPETPDLPWGAAEAGCVGTFLRANPRVAVEIVQRCLDHRLLSDDHAPGERIHRWFADVLRYSHAPLDRYRLPKPQPAPAKLVAADDEETARKRREHFVRRAVERRSQGKALSDLERTLLRQEGL